MKVVVQKVWSEPAVFIGLIVTLGLLAAALITHQAIDVGIIVGILAPFASALGIRQFVTPTKGAPMTETPEPTQAPEPTEPAAPAADDLPAPDAEPPADAPNPYETEGPAEGDA